MYERRVVYRPGVSTTLARRVFSLVAAAGLVAGCSGTSSHHSSSLATPSSSRQSTPSGGNSSDDMSSTGTRAGWTHILDRRSGISFDLPASPRVVNQSGPIGSGANCHTRSWIASQGQRPVIQVSVDIATNCDRRLGPRDLHWVPTWVTEAEREAGGKDIGSRQLMARVLDDGSVEVDWVILYTQSGGARQTSSWFVHAIENGSSLLIAETIGFPYDRSRLPATLERPIQNDLVSSVRMP